MLCVIIIVYTALYKDIVFHEGIILQKLFISYCCSSYTLFNVKCISLVYLYYIVNIWYLIISFPVTRWSKSLVHARLWFEIKQLKNFLGFNSDCNV